MSDPYLYKGTDVLKNRLGIMDNEMLQNAEVECSCNAIHNLDIIPLDGEYDLVHLCQFHRYIFQDVYEWAGKPRVITMEKEEPVLGGLSVLYSQPENIIHEATTVLNNMRRTEWSKLTLDEQAGKLTDCIAELWKVHPFREGNTRVTVTFVCHFAESRGIPIDRELFENNPQYMRNALVAASAVFPEGDMRKNEYLNRIVKDSLERGVQRETLQNINDQRERPQHTLADYKKVIEERRARDHGGSRPSTPPKSKDKPGHDDR